MIFVLLWVGILLSGMDTISLKVLNSTIRFSQIIFLIITICLIFRKKYKIYKKFNKEYLLILFPHLISLFHTKSLKESFLYFIFIIYNYFFLIIPIINLCTERSNQYIIKNYIKIFRVIGMLTVIQFFLGMKDIVFPYFQNDIYKGIFRPSLWFYEPSYLATYFSFYIGIALVGYIYDSKKYRKDLLLSWIFTAITTSSTGFISIFISILFMLYLEPEIIKKLKIIFFSLICMLNIIIIILLIKPDIIYVFIGRLFTSGIGSSSGLRVIGIYQAIDIFKQYPLMGVGANAYKVYHYTKMPVTNVTLEILANIGVIGFVCFILFFKYLFQLYLNNKITLEAKMMWLSLVLFIIVLQANQNYMRTYMWLHIALYLGIIKNIKKDEV